MKSVLLAATCVLLFVACGPRCGTVATPTTATPSPSPSSKVLLDDQGSGNRSTGTFTVPSEWSVAWTFSCPARCTFTVQVHNADGSQSSQDRGFTESDVAGQGVLRYHTGGTFFLTVDTCCVHTAWTLKVVG